MTALAPQPLTIRTIAGYTAEGDVLGVDWALHCGRTPFVVNPYSWPLPRRLQPGTLMARGPERIGVTDELVDFRENLAFLRPPSLAVGIETGSDASPEDVEDALIALLADARVARSSVARVATHDVRAAEPAVLSIGLPVLRYPGERLDRVGAVSVAEAAARLAAGREGRLVVAERRFRHVTLSLARRLPPRPIDVRDQVYPWRARPTAPAGAV